MVRIFVKGEFHRYQDMFKKKYGKIYNQISEAFEEEEKKRKATSPREHILLLKKYKPDIVLMEKTGVRSHVERFLEKHNIPFYDIDISDERKESEKMLLEKRKYLRAISEGIFDKILSAHFAICAGKDRKKHDKIASEFIDLLKDQLKEEKIYNLINKWRIRKIANEIQNAKPLHYELYSEEFRVAYLHKGKRLFKICGKLKSKLYHAFSKYYDREIAGPLCKERSKQMYETAIKLIGEKYKRPYLIVGKDHAKDLKKWFGRHIKLV